MISSNEKVTIKQANMKLLKRKVLREHLDSELLFDYHISEIYKKQVVRLMRQPEYHQT